MAKRDLIAQLYRPTGLKPVRRGNAWGSGGQLQIAQGVDLSLPIRGFRFILSGRLVTAGAAMASANPEGILNLISRIRVTGTNRRQSGNVTLWDIDLASLWTMQHLFERSAAYFTINDVHRAVPTTPFPAVGANGYLDTANGTYDFRIAVDMPFHPFAAPAGVRAGFLVRQEEYKDSLQIQVDYGTVTNGAVACCLGTGQAATTYTLTAYGSALGTPTLDIYSLPMSMGLDLKDAVQPGLLSRTSQPLAGVLQAAANGITLVDMQKKKTTRVILKVGTSTVNPHFATLSDANVTQLGIMLGGNRAVRDVVDIFGHKADVQQQYGREPIQGYNVLDFIQSGNPDSAYPADQIGDGSKFELIANVAGVANAYGIAIQEQMIFSPDGELYNPE